VRFWHCASRDSRNSDQRPQARSNREIDSRLPIFVSRSFARLGRSRKAADAAIQYALRVGTCCRMGNDWQVNASMVCPRRGSSSTDEIVERSERYGPVHPSRPRGRSSQSFVECSLQERQKSRFRRTRNDSSRLKGGRIGVQIRQTRRQLVRGACFQVAGIGGSVICPRAGAFLDVAQARLTTRFNHPRTCGIYLAVARDGRLFVCRLSSLSRL
jgi:hypothetical protein